MSMMARQFYESGEQSNRLSLILGYLSTAG
jgi:hypothetical protein